MGRYLLKPSSIQNLNLMFPKIEHQTFHGYIQRSKYLSLEVISLIIIVGTKYYLLLYLNEYIFLYINNSRYIVPLRNRSVNGKRITIVRLPAPTALHRPLSARALLARWLMILDIR